VLEFFSPLIAGPVLPATILLGFLVGWSLLALLGAAEVDVSGPNTTVDGGSTGVEGKVDVTSATDAVSGLGMTTLRWLNLHEVPLMVWGGAFIVAFWLISIHLWLFIDAGFFGDPNLLWSSVLVVRNLLLAAAITKLVTQPMRGWFKTERLTSGSLIGQECEISSLEASSEFGQVKLKTDGSPLLLNVRTDGAHLAKGARVWIVHYDSSRRVYIVSPTTTSGSSVSHSSFSERE
jgi:hypothetical protein